jgi:hypothetical protein
MHATSPGNALAAALTHSILASSFRSVCAFIIHTSQTSLPRSHCRCATQISIGGIEINDDFAMQLHFNLQKMRDDLLSNPSKLKSIKQQHESNNVDDEELSPDALVQETLLSSRLPLKLNRTRVADSNLPDAGRGLFATQDIAKGELITCYPGDALLCEYKEDITDEEELFQDDESEVILWGDHVDSNDIVEDDEVFDGTDDTSAPLVSYAATVNDVYSVMGMPSLDNDPAYYGHFANDGGGHIALEGVDEAMGVEEMLALYVEKSVEVANARHVPLGGYDGLHLGTVAIKDIKKGDEILVTYGPEYWMDLNF